MADITIKISTVQQYLLHRLRVVGSGICPLDIVERESGSGRLTTHAIDYYVCMLQLGILPRHVTHLCLTILWKYVLHKIMHGPHMRHSRFLAGRSKQHTSYSSPNKYLFFTNWRTLWWILNHSWGVFWVISQFMGDRCAARICVCTNSLHLCTSTSYKIFFQMFMEIQYFVKNFVLFYDDFGVCCT